MSGLFGSPRHVCPAFRFRGRILGLSVAVCAAAWAPGTAPAIAGPPPSSSDSGSDLGSAVPIPGRGSPQTISAEIPLDLAAALSRSFVGGGRLLAGGAIHTSLPVHVPLVRSCPGFWFTAFGLVWDQQGTG